MRNLFKRVQQLNAVTKVDRDPLDSNPLGFEVRVASKYKELGELAHEIGHSAILDQVLFEQAEDIWVAQQRLNMVLDMRTK